MYVLKYKELLFENIPNLVEENHNFLFQISIKELINNTMEIKCCKKNCTGNSVMKIRINNSYNNYFDQIIKFNSSNYMDNNIHFINTSIVNTITIQAVNKNCNCL